MKIFLSLLAFLLSVQTYAATGSVGSSSSTGTKVGTSSSEGLSIKEIIPTTLREIEIEFNMKVLPESVRLSITKQSDNSSVGVESVSLKDNDSTSSTVIQVKLSDALSDNTSYKLTLISASSDTGANIQEGAEAIREFSTPNSFSQNGEANITLNAPNNPNAVLSIEPSVGNSFSGITNTNIANTSTSASTPVATTALPTTGMNPLILLLIGLPVILFFLPKRSDTGTNVK